MFEAQELEFEHLERIFQRLFESDDPVDKVALMRERKEILAGMTDGALIAFALRVSKQPFYEGLDLEDVIKHIWTQRRMGLMRRGEHKIEAARAHSDYFFRQLSGLYELSSVELFCSLLQEFVLQENQAEQLASDLGAMAESATGDLYLVLEHAMNLLALLGKARNSKNGGS